MSNALGDSLRATLIRRGRQDLIERAMSMPPVFDKTGGWEMDGLAHLLEQNELVFDARLDRRFRHAELRDPRVLEWISLNAENPIEHSHLLLMGDTGVGKTYALHGALKKMVTAAAGRGEQPTWEYITLLELARRMQDFRGDGSKVLFDRLLEADILVLDEMGTVTDRADRDGTGWVTRWLGDLVDTRYRKCKTSMYATNCSVKELAEIVQNDRVISRLVEGRNRIVMTGDDLRAQKMGRIDG